MLNVIWFLFWEAWTYINMHSYCIIKYWRMLCTVVRPAKWRLQFTSVFAKTDAAWKGKVMKWHRQVRAKKWRIRSSATIAFNLQEFGLGFGIFRSGFSGRVGFRRSEFSRGWIFGSEFSAVNLRERVFGGEFSGASFLEWVFRERVFGGEISGSEFSGSEIS
jgi:hypothetical protein